MKYELLRSAPFVSLSLIITLVGIYPCEGFSHPVSESQKLLPEMQEVRLIDRMDGSGPKKMKLIDAMGYSAKSHESGRCAGFMDVTHQPKYFNSVSPKVEWFKLMLGDRSLKQGDYLKGALPILDSARLSDTVKKLSQFRNRYYKSETGVEAAQFIADQFKQLAANRNDIDVSLFKHQRWDQPSVVVTMQGRGPKKNEIVVIGGHEDSINQSAFGNRKMEAPGADDNASGIATVLEVFRVLVQSGYKPNRTLMFMAYAAEEVGLLGSQEIANRFNAEKKAVVGVMQLDMTGFPGSGNQVVFMTDFVSAELTQFTGVLMDTYVKTRWGTDKCGYACSDHASWTKAGFPSVMPFESKFSADNKDIHTTRDVIGKLDFNHALSFARLGLSFMAELASE